MKYKEIITKLKNRLKQGETQADIAKELKVSRAFVSDILAGKRNMSLKVLKRLGYEVEYKQIEGK